MKIIAQASPPDRETKARLMAQLLALGWWDQMTPVEREALLERGQILDTPFGREHLLPIAKKCT